jgi:hypothetical protein
LRWTAGRGWSGAAIIREPTWAKDQLNSASVLLPGIHSSPDQIVDQLLALGGRYHRYLHQDEFGPKRGEQIAALRDQLRILDLLIARLAILPGRAREVLSNFLASKPPLPSAAQFDITALEQLYEASFDAKQPNGNRRLTRAGKSPFL